MNVFLDTDGHAIGAIGAGRDVTVRRRAELERDRFIEHSLTPMCINGFDGFFKSVNSAFEHTFGYSRDELLRKPFMDTVHPDDCERAGLEAQRIIAGGVCHEFEIRIRCKDGSYKWMAWNSVPYQDHEAFYTIGHDVTSRHAAEEALRESEEGLRTITESIPNIVFMCRADAWNFYVNLQWVNYTGRTVAESEGYGWKESFHPDEQQAVLEAWKHATETGEQFEFEGQLRRADGIYHWHLFRALPLRDNSGQVVKWFGTGTDIDSQKLIAVELQEAKLDADSANRAKSEFLANMSHEIRTPMAAIIGYTETMLEPDQTPSDRQNALQVIRRSARHLLDLINDILDVSKIEAGKMTVERITTDVAQIAAEVVSLLRPTAVTKGLGFQLTFGDAIPRTILSDPLRVKQVLMNLVGNAVKFTKQGEIRLRVTSETEGETSSVVFEISDTGIGIPPEQIRRLFKPFTQVDDSTTRHFGGSGLGLAISKRFAELLGGGITVDSFLGVGSTFRLKIAGGPLAGVELLNGLTEAALIRPSNEGVKRRITLKGRILLAEDGPDNQQLLSLHLRNAGAEVVIAENGRIAVDLVKSEPFDLVLMDMQMPELDGFAATSELRACGYTLPIIAQTAHAMAEDRAECLAAGCTDYLTKPIAKSTLLTTVAGYLPGSVIGDAESVRLSGDSSAPRETLKSSLSDDPDMKAAIEDFVAVLPRRVMALNQFLSERNLIELERAVHQIKGAGGGYGFDDLSRLAADAEQAMKAKDPLEKIRAKVDSLVALIRSVDGYQTPGELTHA